jgi:hypothetical protein
MSLEVNALCQEGRVTLSNLAASKALSAIHLWPLILLGTAADLGREREAYRGLLRACLPTCGEGSVTRAGRLLARAWGEAGSYDREGGGFNLNFEAKGYDYEDDRDARDWIDESSRLGSNILLYEKYLKEVFL